LGGDVDLDHPLGVLVFGRPRERGDGVAERDAAVESGPEVGGSGERVYVIGQATGDDREKIVEGIDAVVLSDGTVANGDGTPSRILVMKRTRKIPPRSRAKRK
jgi:hypothetical protein